MQTRYKYKLNMLDPGGKLCAAIGIGILISLLFWILKLTYLALFTGALTGLLTLILILLLIIEAHQDRILYEDAKKEDPEIK